MRVVFGDCTFDSAARMLERGGRPVRLTGKAFALLEALLAARPRPVPKEELFARLWHDTFVAEANLASLVKEVRAAVGDDARDPRFIRTVHRFGYAFIGAADETVAARTAAASRYTANVDAYHDYLKGRHHWNRRTVDGIAQAVAHFESAIAHDAAYAPAWSGLADCAIALASRDLQPPLAVLPRAEEHARHALSLDGALAEAHASLAAIHELLHWRWSEAEAEYRAALRLDPESRHARQWYALGLAHRARFTEAVDQMRIAAASDPLSFAMNAAAAAVHYLARDFDAAVEACARALEINPHHEPAHFTRGLALQQRGELDAARQALERARTIARDEPHVIAALGALAAARGDAGAARASLARLDELRATRLVSPVHIATVRTAFGDHDAALEELTRAAEMRSGWLLYLRTEPRFDPLRGNRAFEAIVAKI